MRPRALAVAAALLLASLAVGLVGSAALFGGERAGRGDSLRGRLGALAGGPEAATKFSPRALQSVGRGASVVATARGRSIRVYARRGGKARKRLRQRRTSTGRPLPLVFLVKARRKGWVQAYLPTRPNLSKGWLRASSVRLAATPFRVKVRLASHRLVLLRGGKPIMRTRIGVGRAISPTPTGRYYVTDLLRPPDPGGLYGPYALGLSAHSPVYTTFGDGDGQIGLHGTNQPWLLGTDVSHGCIRLSNRAISRLAKLLPLGTPVDVGRT